MTYGCRGARVDRNQFIQEWVIRHGKHEPGAVTIIAAQGGDVYDQLVALGYADKPQRPDLATHIPAGPLPVKTYTQGAFAHPAPAERPMPPERKGGLVPLGEDKDLASLKGWQEIYRRNPSPANRWWLNQARRKCGMEDEPGEMEPPLIEQPTYE